MQYLVKRRDINVLTVFIYCVTWATQRQIVDSCDPSDPQSLCRRLEVCLADVASWMSSNRLQLNTSKTELMWCSSSGRRHQVPTDSLVIGLDAIKPVAAVKDLGLYLDARMSMRDHISRLTSTCFGVLRQIRGIRRSLSSRARTMLVTCFVFARLNYCNAMFTGLPRCDLDRLQAVQNAAVRLIAGVRKFDHVTPMLRERHWLQVEHRITFKIAVMTYKCVHGMTADCLADYIRPPFLGQRLPPGTDLSLWQSACPCHIGRLLGY